MPQAPFGSYVAKKSSSGALGPMSLDNSGLLLTSSGGSTPAYNLTAATVVKATSGRLCKIIVVNPGTTGGGFTFNDCATTGAAAASNEIFTIAYNATADVSGLVVTLDWPCLTGIVLSAVPTGGTPIISVSFA